MFYSFIRILSSNKTMKINKTESQARTLINLTKAARHRRGGCFKMFVKIIREVIRYSFCSQRVSQVLRVCR